MEKNIFLEIEYEGTGYFGFQIQNKKNKNELTVQEVLEKCLERLFNRKIRIIYSSRTDRGVHAKAQAVNFTVDSSIALTNIKRALNSFLPPDIRIKRVKKVPLGFHSRFSVKSKVYRYAVFNNKEPSVFQRNFAWHVDIPLDVEFMQKCANRFKGKRDFSLFAKDAKNYKSCVRDIKSISVKKRRGFIYIDIEADGFLRGMARRIVFFLVQAGRGEIGLKAVASVLAGDTRYTSKPAPSCGLYLSKVKY